MDKFSMPLEMLLAFFSRQAANDRNWLAICCAFEIEDEMPKLDTTPAADQWFRDYLKGAKRPEQSFGRLLQVIAILDFQLSPLSVSRTEARAQHMLESDNQWIVDRGREMLQATVPRLKNMASAWSDVRMHELDEASLWIYRDELERRGMAEIGRQFGFR